MPAKKPERDQWMNVDEREAKEVRTKPVKRTECERNRNGPAPIRARFLFGAQPDQQHEPKQQQGVPRCDERGPGLIAPKPQVVEQWQRDVSGAQYAEANKRREKEVA